MQRRRPGGFSHCHPLAVAGDGRGGARQDARHDPRFPAPPARDLGRRVHPATGNRRAARRAPALALAPLVSERQVRVLVQKAFFSWHDVREGDIVVFSHPPLDQCPGAGDLVKRVIALPGQTIYFVGQQHLRERAAASRALPAALRPARAADSEQAAPLPGCRPASSTCWATTGRTRATAGTRGRSRAQPSSARWCWFGGTTATPTSTGSDPAPDQGAAWSQNAHWCWAAKAAEVMVWLWPPGRRDISWPLV